MRSVGVMVVMALLVGLAPRASATREERIRVPAPDNAALLYWRAWAMEPAELFKAVDREFNGRELAWTPSAETSQALESGQGFVHEVLRSTRIARCDFGIEYGRGRRLSMPHLDRIRSTSRVLVSDCRRLLAEDRVEESVDRAVALLAMALQLRQDRLVSSSSFAQGLARMGADEVLRLAPSGKLSTRQRELLRAALAAVRGEDPFGFANSIRMEGASNRTWISSFSGVKAGDDFYHAIAVGGEPQDVAEAIMRFDALALNAATEKAETYFDRAAAAWTSDKAVDSLRDLERGVLSLEFGPVAVLIAPGMSSAKAQSIEQAKVIERAAAALEAAPSAPLLGPTVGPAPK